MITQLVLPNTLDPALRTRIERQLDMTLASVRWQIRRMTLVLDRDEQAATDMSDAATYHCRMEAKLRSGRHHVLTVRNTDPQGCTADVAARLRREIIRDRQLGLVGRVS